MGYHSEIAIELMRSDYDKLCNIMKQHTFDYNVLDAADFFERRMPDGGKVVTLHWDWIKWYSDDSIESIEEFLDTVPFHKMKIGEEIDDVYEYTSLDWPYDIEDVYIEHRISGWNIGEQLNKTE